MRFPLLRNARFAIPDGFCRASLPHTGFGLRRRASRGQGRRAKLFLIFLPAAAEYRSPLPYQSRPFPFAGCLKRRYSTPTCFFTGFCRLLRLGFSLSPGRQTLLNHTQPAGPYRRLCRRKESLSPLAGYLKAAAKVWQLFFSWFLQQTAPNRFLCQFLPFFMPPPFSPPPARRRGGGIF